MFSKEIYHNCHNYISLLQAHLSLMEDCTFTEVYLLQCKLLPVATRLAEDLQASVRLAVAAQCDRLVDVHISLNSFIVLICFILTIQNIVAIN